MIEKPASLKIQEVDSDFRVLIEEGEKICSEELQSLVDQIWNSEKKKKGDVLFNGKILSIEAVNSQLLTGRFVSYKMYVAQALRKDLKDRLGICPLGVSGVVIKGNKVLIGKRSSWVTRYSGFYECAPSGSLDTNFVHEKEIDFLSQLKAELFEETGMVLNSSEHFTPFALIQDPKLPIADLCAFVCLLEDHEFQVSQEYPELFWLSMEDLQEFVEKNKERMVPTTLAILHLLPKYL